MSEWTWSIIVGALAVLVVTVRAWRSGRREAYYLPRPMPDLDWTHRAGGRR